MRSRSGLRAAVSVCSVVIVRSTSCRRVRDVCHQNPSMVRVHTSQSVNTAHQIVNPWNPNPQVKMTADCHIG